MLTLIRRCRRAAFPLKTASEDISATGYQWFCRRVFMSSKGLAMLIRSADIEAFDRAAAARTIAAASLPTLSLLGIGLLLLSCP